MVDATKYVPYILAVKPIRGVVSKWVDDLLGYFCMRTYS
jgi:hypothetical protein